MSENTEMTESREVSESSAEAKAEGRALEDATTTPESHIEQTQTYQEAEAVEILLTSSLEATLSTTNVEAATSLDESAVREAAVAAGK